MDKRPWKIASGDLHLWRARLDVSPKRRETLWASLSSGEQERAARFRFAADGDHFAAARGVLRTLLARYAGETPPDLTFDYGPQGKPALAPPHDALHFNLSHSGNLALIAVRSHSAVGVDLECICAGFPAAETAARFLSPEAFAALSALPEDARQTYFFRCWTRSEAYSKLRGHGFSQGFQGLDVSAPTTKSDEFFTVRVDGVAESDGFVCDLDIAPGYAAALAVESRPRRIVFREGDDAGSEDASPGSEEK